MCVLVEDVLVRLSLLAYLVIDVCACVCVCLRPARPMYSSFPFLLSFRLFGVCVCVPVAGSASLHRGRRDVYYTGWARHNSGPPPTNTREQRTQNTCTRGAASELADAAVVVAGGATSWRCANVSAAHVASAAVPRTGVHTRLAAAANEGERGRRGSVVRALRLRLRTVVVTVNALHCEARPSHTHAHTHTPSSPLPFVVSSTAHTALETPIP